MDGFDSLVTLSPSASVSVSPLPLSSSSTSSSELQAPVFYREISAGGGGRPSTGISSCSSLPVTSMKPSSKQKLKTSTLPASADFPLVQEEAVDGLISPIPKQKTTKPSGLNSSLVSSPIPSLGSVSFSSLTTSSLSSSSSLEKVDSDWQSKNSGNPLRDGLSCSVRGSKSGSKHESRKGVGSFPSEPPVLEAWIPEPESLQVWTRGSTIAPEKMSSTEAMENNTKAPGRWCAMQQDDVHHLLPLLEAPMREEDLFFIHFLQCTLNINQT